MKAFCKSPPPIGAGRQLFIARSLPEAGQAVNKSQERQKNSPPLHYIGLSEVQVQVTSPRCVALCVWLDPSLPSNIEPAEVPESLGCCTYLNFSDHPSLVSFISRCCGTCPSVSDSFLLFSTPPGSPFRFTLLPHAYQLSAERCIISLLTRNATR